MGYPDRYEPRRVFVCNVLCGRDFRADLRGHNARYI
jgi:hypothetical protein